MKKHVDVSGFCPAQNCDYEISVTYASIRSLGTNESYRKIDAECDYASMNPCEYATSCPVFTSAPHVLN